MFNMLIVMLFCEESPTSSRLSMKGYWFCSQITQIEFKLRIMPTMGRPASGLALS